MNHFLDFLAFLLFFRRLSSSELSDSEDDPDELELERDRRERDLRFERMGDADEVDVAR